MTKIQIKVARQPAKDQAHKLGVLAFNPGGPGGAGASIIAAGGADEWFHELKDKSDIVSWDPRGTGEMEWGDKSSANQRVQMVIVPKNKPADAAPKTDDKPASDQH